MFNNTKLQRAQKRHQPPRCIMQHPQNLQENVLLSQQKHYLQILKNVYSVRIKHLVLNFIKLWCATNQCSINLHRTCKIRNFGKIKRRRCVTQELKYYRACLTSFYNKNHLRLIKFDEMGFFAFSLILIYFTKYPYSSQILFSLLLSHRRCLSQHK